MAQRSSDEEHELECLWEHRGHTGDVWHWRFSEGIWILALMVLGPWASYLSAMSATSNASPIGLARELCKNHLSRFLLVVVCSMCFVDNCSFSLFHREAES